MKNIGNALSFLRIYLNGCLCDTEPWKIVTITSTTVLMSVWAVQLFGQREDILEQVKKTFFKLLKKIPAVSNKIKKEKNTISKKFIEDVESRTKEVPYILTLPTSGWTEAQVLSYIDRCVALGEFDWRKGLASGAVYYQDELMMDMLAEVYRRTAYTNPLHTDLFPGVCKMEAEVVRIVANLFHGTSDTCGTMTSGGSESIMMACKALRDYSRHERGIKHGEIVLPTTAHPAFDKAASYLNIKIVHVPVDPVTFCVNISKMGKAITKNTIMLVGSMPNFPYGTSDNIEQIAALGSHRGVPVHVDCCLGGFLTAFMPAAGYPLPPFDFSLPGVTSISIDPHKYGFTPKGASVVLYARPELRRHQYTVSTDWPGGVYGSPTISGSRAGGTIAVCWASLMHFGYEGYLAATKKIIATTRYIEQKLREMDDIVVFGTPATSVIAFGSPTFHIFKLAEVLTAKGWNLNILQFPSGIHLCVTHMHTKGDLADRFLADVQDAIQEVKKLPNLQDLSEGKMAVYGVAQSLPDRSIVGDITCSYIDSMYFTPHHNGFI